MAKGNMILTLVAQTKNFSKNLQNAGKSVLGFGSIVKTGMGIAVSAIGGLAGALFMILPNLIKMAEEARKSELRLANIAKQMGLFGDNTAAVTQRLSKYAETLSFASGVDDELIRSSEAILLTFKAVAKTADVVGGAFDRATQATIDLAAAGFGDAESNAKQLGKALQDPIKGTTALRKAGVTFTKDEQAKIKALVESNKLLQAQDVILSAIEMQVGGTAAATASATDKMQARFENMAETLGAALLPSVDQLANDMAAWLDSVEGKKAIADLTRQLQEFGAWLSSPSGNDALKDFMTTMKFTADAIINVGKALEWMAGILHGIDYNKLDKVGQNAYNLMNNKSTGSGWSGPTSSIGAKAPAPVTVNVKGITPSVTVGKTVLDAIKNAQRLGAR